MKKIILAVLIVASTLQAKDAKGSKDHPLFSRYPGFYIKEYKQVEYDKAEVITGLYDQTNDKCITTKFEGKVTNIEYSNNKKNNDASVFQMFKNYEQALKKKDANILFSCRNETCFTKKSIINGVFLGSYIRNKRSLFKGLFGDVKDYFGIITAKIPQKNGAPSIVSFVISENKSGNYKYILESIIEPKTIDSDKIGIGTVSDVEKKMNKEGKIALKGIYFDFDKSTIKPKSKETLDTIAQYLKKHQNQNFYIVGHTDNQGSYEHNMKLSQNRSKAVKEYLKKDKTISNKLHDVGIGPISPVMSNTTKEGREKNRRVELVLMQ